MRNISFNHLNLSTKFIFIKKNVKQYYSIFCFRIFIVITYFFRLNHWHAKVVNMNKGNKYFIILQLLRVIYFCKRIIYNASTMRNIFNTISIIYLYICISIRHLILGLNHQRIYFINRFLFVVATIDMQFTLQDYIAAINK